MALRTIGLTVAYASLALATDARAWQVADRESTTTLQGAGAVLFEPNGDVVSAGSLGDDPAVVVRRHSSGDGRELWRFRVSGSTSPRDGVSLAHDGAGDLLATLNRELADGSRLGTIVELDPVTGAEKWRRDVPDARFFAIAADASGDAVAVGVIDLGFAQPSEALALKVSGQTGAELWRMIVRGTHPQHHALGSVAVASDGDFFVGGTLATPPNPDGTKNVGFSVVRLRSADASPLWWRQLGSFGAVENLAVDPAGNVVAVGADWDGYVVAKFRGADGELLWRSSSPTPRQSPVFEAAAAVVIDAQGDVFVAGSLADPAWPGWDATGVTTLKLASATGATLWRHDLSNAKPFGSNYCRDRDIALSPRGDVVVFGVLGNYYNKRMIALSLSAGTGSQLWRTPFLGFYTDPAWGTRVAIDPQGSVALVSSRIDCQNGCGAYTVVKLRGRSGRDYFAGCGDEIDDDGDGAVDWPSDIGCAAASSTTESPACQNGVDDDGDGDVDYLADAGCALPSSDTESPPCQNDVDDDGDGLADFPADPGCSRSAGSTEAPACQNGLDDDGDGLVDHPADRGCAALWSSSESPQCQNGRDDDGDRLVDSPEDPGCASPASDLEQPACQNGWDDDGDGALDYDGGASINFGVPFADPDPACAVASRNTERTTACGLGFEIVAAVAALAGARRARRR